MLRLSAEAAADRRTPGKARSLLLWAGQLLSGDKGSVATILGFAAMPLVLLLGLAVDAGIAYNAHSKLQGAVDAAALASARAVASGGGDLKADARMFFDANFPSGFLGGELTSFNARLDGETGAVKVDARVEIPTSFMRIAGLETVPVSASAAAQQAGGGIELALVLDITDSMDDADPSGGTKLDALKRASHALLDVIYGDRETVDNVAISVVPFNAVVNVGAGRADLLTGPAPNRWQGCVEARAEPFDQDDTPPSVAAFAAFVWPALRGRSFGGGLDPNFGCPDSEILPLTAEKSVIAGHILGLRADGLTIPNIGFSWGWRTISPRWQGFWGADSDPVEYNDPTKGKAIVFMTDGFTDFPPGYYGAYGFRFDERLRPRAPSPAEIDDRLLNSCGLAKEAGIDVYAVMFGGSFSTEIEALYRACASSNRHFFDVPDGNALEAAFRNIAQQSTSLRLTQ